MGLAEPGSIGYFGLKFSQAMGLFGNRNLDLSIVMGIHEQVFAARCVSEGGAIFLAGVASVPLRAIFIALDGPLSGIGGS